MRFVHEICIYSPEVVLASKLEYIEYTLYVCIGLLGLSISKYYIRCISIEMYLS